MANRRIEIEVTDPQQVQKINAFCGFCQGRASAQESDIILDGTLWLCSCDAAGVSCAPTDLGEAASQLAQYMGLEGVQLGGPPEQIETAGLIGTVSVQRYDSD